MCPGESNVSGVQGEGTDWSSDNQSLFVWKKCIRLTHLCLFSFMFDGSAEWEVVLLRRHCQGFDLVLWFLDFRVCSFDENASSWDSNSFQPDFSELLKITFPWYHLSAIQHLVHYHFHNDSLRHFVILWDAIGGELEQKRSGERCAGRQMFLNHLRIRDYRFDILVKRLCVSNREDHLLGDRMLISGRRGGENAHKCPLTLYRICGPWLLPSCSFLASSRCETLSRKVDLASLLSSSLPEIYSMFLNQTIMHNVALWTDRCIQSLSLFYASFQLEVILAINPACFSSR